MRLENYYDHIAKFHHYRLVVNTLNCVLVYYFVKRDWDYTAPRNTNESYRPNVANVIESPLHSQSRALKVKDVTIHQKNFMRQISLEGKLRRVKFSSLQKIWA